MTLLLGLIAMGLLASLAALLCRPTPDQRDARIRNPRQARRR